jgi:hypothetical protein
MELRKISELLGLNSFVKDSNSVKPVIVVKQGVISALASPDTLFSVTGKKQAVISPFANKNLFSADFELQQKQSQSLNSARAEWQNGVKENLGRNSGTRVNQYYKNSGFDSGGDGGWCGFFVAFNYAQLGFTKSPHLAGMEKARDFFTYRQYTDHSKEKNATLDSLRQKQQLEGSQRQYFMLEESPGKEYFSNYKNQFKNYDVAANTFNYKTLPVRPGDTVLFNTGKAGGHVGMVASYDPLSGKLVTIEGNAIGMASDGKKRSNAVITKEYDLTNSTVRSKIEGFGRPALGDFN